MQRSKIFYKKYEKDFSFANLRKLNIYHIIFFHSIRSLFMAMLHATDIVSQLHSVLCFVSPVILNILLNLLLNSEHKVSHYYQKVLPMRLS